MLNKFVVIDDATQTVVKKYDNEREARRFVLAAYAIDGTLNYVVAFVQEVADQTIDEWKYAISTNRTRRGYEDWMENGN